MHEFAAHGTTLPPTFEQRGISIQHLMTHPTMFGLNAQHQGLPFSCRSANTHEVEYIQMGRGITKNA